MVAWGGFGALLELAPGGIVALGEPLGRSIRVNVVAQGEDRPVGALDEPSGCLVAPAAAPGDVARRYDQRRSGRRSVRLLPPTAMD